MSGPKLNMHYPSKPTCYFAVGGWGEKPREKSAKFENDPITGIPKYNGRKAIALEQGNQRLLALFQGHLNANSPLTPSTEDCRYWIQAKVTEKCLPRLLNITCNSGKFLVFIPKGYDIDVAWNAFKDRYKVGDLGYAIQSSTARESLNSAGTSASLITVHMEDSFDLAEISKTAYAIFETLLKNKPNYEGVIQYMTDRSTRARAHCKDPKRSAETEVLYSISSRTYLNNSFDKADKTPKTKELFEQLVTSRLVPKAQERQNLLKSSQKTWGE